MHDAVACIVFGHWSQDGDLKVTHINGNFTNWFLGSSENEWEKIIDAFSHNGQTVLVLMDAPEPGMLSAM